MKQEELKKINNEIGAYVTHETKTIWVDEQTMQIATMMIDSYGDTVYVLSLIHISEPTRP